MNKIKGLFLMLFILGLFQKTLLAQIVSKNVANSFSPSIVRKIYEKVLTKIPLTESTQFWLGSAYKQQDSLIASLLFKRFITEKEIRRIEDSSDVAIELGLKEIMTPIERNDFKFNIDEPRLYALPIYKDKIIEDAEMNSQFGIAYKMRDQIGLTDSQSIKILKCATELRKKIEFSEENPDSGFFDRAAFESEQMAKILNDRQINPVLALKNKKACQLQAKYDWHDITKMGLAGNFNKDSAIKQITVYYLIKAHITDRFANEKEKRALLYKGIKMPEPLIALQKAKQGENAKLEKYAW